ncbi:hypothetical protein [Exiguobacterium sp. JLM-2]|uniref:hypothetical protein n=1 Tax=Exiguobacterium sp. JLM-2 TaxID=1647415 RepID=UPI000649F93A|nr:hypothetical protein [Exiguobacterium sp. JLM-2]
MVSALETNATGLGINVSADSYASLDTGKKQSVANFVLERKGTGYQAESVVRHTFNAGLAYETAKVTFSTQLKSDVTSTDVEAMKAAYQAVVTIDGTSSSVITANVAVLDKVIGAGNEAALAKLNEFADLNGQVSPVDNTYTINVDSLTKFLEEFDQYLTTSQI